MSFLSAFSAAVLSDLRGQKKQNRRDRRGFAQRRAMSEARSGPNRLSRQSTTQQSRISL